MGRLAAFSAINYAAFSLLGFETHSHAGVLEQAGGVKRRWVVLDQTEPSSQVVADRVTAHQVVHLALQRLLALTHCKDMFTFTISDSSHILHTCWEDA